MSPQATGYPQYQQNPYGQYGYGGPNQGPGGFPPYGGSIPGSFLASKQQTGNGPLFGWSVLKKDQPFGGKSKESFQGTQAELDAYQASNPGLVEDIHQIQTGPPFKLSAQRALGSDVAAVRGTQEIIDQARYEDLEYRQAQESAIYGQMNAIQQGFGRAKSQLNRFQQHGIQSAQDIGARTRASLRDDLTSRGLGQTTALVQADVQSAGAEMRAIQEHDARMAQLYSNLEVDQTRGEVANFQELVSLYGETSRSQTGFLMEDFFWRAGRYSGGPTPDGPDNSAAIWQAVGAAIGAWLGS